MKKNRLMLITIAAIVIVGLSIPLLTQIQRPKKTFYVVAHFWGYVFYDENFKEIRRIEVKKGDLVTIYAIPAAAVIRDLSFPGEYREYRERSIRRGVGEWEPRDQRIEQEMVRLRDEALVPRQDGHSVSIAGYVDVVPDQTKVEHQPRNSWQEVFEANRAAIAVAEFRADRVGSFAIFCNVLCGYGHPFMSMPDAFVVHA